MKKLSLAIASLVVLATLSGAHAFRLEEPSNGTQSLTSTHDLGGSGHPREDVSISGSYGWSYDDGASAKIELAQTYDHTWAPGWGAPYNPGVIVNDARSKGSWQYQYYAIQTGGTNGFVIVYYNLVCVGPGKCPSTAAAPSCWITGYGNGPCAEGANASIPRNI